MLLEDLCRCSPWDLEYAGFSYVAGGRLVGNGSPCLDDFHS